MEATQEIGNIKLETGSDMLEHLHKLYQVFDELAEQDTPLQTITTLEITLGSVRKEYDNVVTAIEAWDEEGLTMKNVRAKLVKEYDKKQMESRRTKVETKPEKTTCELLAVDQLIHQSTATFMEFQLPHSWAIMNSQHSTDFRKSTRLPILLLSCVALVLWEVCRHKKPPVWETPME